MPPENPQTSLTPSPEGEKKQPSLTPEQAEAKELLATQESDKRRFQELKTKVDELNGEIQKAREGEKQGMELGKDLSFQLFNVIKELNTKLSLGIENTSVDIHSEGENLVVQYSGFETRDIPKDKPFTPGDTGGNYKIIIKPDHN